MREQAKIQVHAIGADPDQPRKCFDEAELLALAHNILKHGQQVPVIVYQTDISKSRADSAEARYMLLDGERRWRAVQLVAGINELDAIVLPEKPGLATLRTLQISLEAHKIGLTAMERSDVLQRIRVETDWSVSELADQLSMKQPLVSKLLALQKLAPEIQSKLRSREFEDIEKAYLLSQAEQPEQQLRLMDEAPKLSREQLRQRLSGTAEPKTPSASFALPDGVVVSVRGSDLTLSKAIETLVTATKALRRGLAQQLDIHTVQRVMVDRSKARPA